jgi:hypothetical protein
LAREEIRRVEDEIDRITRSFKSIVYAKQHEIDGEGLRELRRELF